MMPHGQHFTYRCVDKLQPPRAACQRPWIFFLPQDRQCCEESLEFHHQKESRHGRVPKRVQRLQARLLALGARGQGLPTECPACGRPGEWAALGLVLWARFQASWFALFPGPLTQSPQELPQSHSPIFCLGSECGQHFLELCL